MTRDAFSRRQLLRAAGISTAIGLAGCMASDASSTSTPTEDPGSHHDESGSNHDGTLGNPVDHATVKMVATDEGYHFEPHAVHITVGGTVTWELESGSHTATAYHSDNDRPQRVPDGAANWDSGVLSEQGDSFEHTCETAGVYDYFCIPHEAMGMIGTIVVGTPDAAGQPGLAAPQGSLPDEAQHKIEELNEMVRKQV